MNKIAFPPPYTEHRYGTMYTFPQNMYRNARGSELGREWVYSNNKFCVEYWQEWVRIIRGTS